MINKKYHSKNNPRLPNDNNFDNKFTDNAIDNTNTNSKINDIRIILLIYEATLLIVVIYTLSREVKTDFVSCVLLGTTIQIIITNQTIIIIYLP